MPTKNNINDFNNSWLGYDLPYDLIEQQPSVQTLRKAGIEKRVKAPEFHVTVAYFPDVNLYELSEALKQAEKKYGQSLQKADFNFDGYGVVDQPQGRYVYFSPDPDSAPQAFFLKDFLAQFPIYTPDKNCDDLHLSVGGPDPFSKSKPRSWPMNNPFQANGRLVFVGNDGKQFRKYVWQGEEDGFVEITNTTAPKQSPDNQPRTARAIHTIAMFPKIQADTAASFYILKNFGEKLFPGVNQAKVVFWTSLPGGKSAKELEAEGYLTIDLGGEFDHHLANEQLGKRTECAATIVARYLGVENDVTLKKLLAWAKRDDLQGKGTVSVDPLDRAFGLSGIIMNANREYASDPRKALDLIEQIIDLHVREEKRRQVELPQELEKLEQTGKIEKFDLRQGSAELKAAFIETENIAMAGFLRAAKKIDLIIQRRVSGHTNIVTQQLRSIDLRPLIAVIRLSEADKKGIQLQVDESALMSAGRLAEIEEWYYDNAANSIQNGGISPEGVTPTKLSRPEIIALVKEAVPLGTIGTLKREKEQELT
ncbi:MAG: hypothetical protein PHC70_02600 [Patescibacteria group bacterium]|nr:hypothetical protein [Patescibacteria group bacterium]